MSIRMLGALVVGLCLATRATAQVEAETEGQVSMNDVGAPSSEANDSEDAPYERGQGAGITLGLKLGGGFSQPFGDLGTSFLTELEVGYTLPVAKRSFAVFLSGAYTAPGAEGKDLKDERLPGPASYELTQQESLLTLGLTYRLHLPTKLVRPYASIGPRLFLMRTTVSGSAGGEDFGENDETGTDIGIFGALGAELHVGPGAALFELSMTWAKVDGYVLRDTSAGSLGVGLGYRLFL
ncbi:MAG TPA: outer membrane beta-barrel protein [Polyangiales bacterium]|nr:outer membrane beta-barrel protein [Polyangiales bacterium]